MDIYKLKHLWYWLRAKGSGLQKTPRDDRDFQVADLKELGWGLGYTPKYNYHIIPGFGDAYDQNDLLSCQWYATAKQEETDYREPMSPRGLVNWGRQNGLTGNLGLSNIRSGQLALQKFGVLSQRELPEMYNNANSWSQYAYVNIDAYKDKAAQRKISTFWAVSSKNDLLKALDEGKPILTGIDWRTVYNRSGGRKDYWYIRDKAGYSVGGHALCIGGYNLAKNYLIVQNSYSNAWGKEFIDPEGNSIKGGLCIDIDFFLKNNYGCYINLNVDYPKALTVDDITTDYSMKNVKGDKEPGIYMILNGQRHPYVSWDAFMCWNADKTSFTVLPQNLVDQIPIGDALTVNGSPHYDYWQQLKKPVEYN